MHHIVIINAVYPPEPVVSAQMGRDLAEFLAHSGSRVTVFCPYPTRPFGASYSAFQPSNAPRVVAEKGVEVVRLPSFTAPHSRFVPRMRESWSFGRHVCRYLQMHLCDVDVVYANTWPLFSPALIARFCARRDIPLVLHIQDLYPEALMAKLPRYCQAVAISLLMALDRWVARRAARVILISDNMHCLYVKSRRVALEKVVTISNWVDEQCFVNQPTRAQACAHYGIPEACFTFLYLGNIGPVARVEGLIRAFHAAELKQAQLVIAGDGSSKAACVELAKRMVVSGVRFVSDPNADNVPLLQSLAHICLLPMLKGAGLSSIPSKLISYLLSARPVLATVDAKSDTARCIQEAQCGWVGEPEQVKWLARKMAEVARLPSAELEAMGQRGRTYGLKQFSKAEGVKRLAKLVVSSAWRRSAAMTTKPI